MATNSTVAQYKGMDQARDRDHAVWFDQHRSTTFRTPAGVALFEHGRPYYSIIEKATRMPVGPVMPFGWEAPFIAPMKYLLKSIGRVTNLPASTGLSIASSVSTDRFRLDYATMKREDEEQAVAHWRLAVAESAARDWTVPKYGAAMDRRLLAIVGPAPRSPKIAEACMAGNPWILGQLMPTFDPHTNTMRVEEDEQLARLLLLNRDDVLTPEQADEEEARELAQPSGEMRELLAEALEQNRKLAAMLAEAEAKKADAADRMAKARAARGKDKKAPAEKVG